MADVELTRLPDGDSRRSPRVDFNGQVELSAQDELADAPRVLLAQAFDLGPGGVGLSAQERLPVGTKVTCRMSLSGRAAEIDGHVAWIRAHTSPRPHGLGVCFEGLGHYERVLITHELERTPADERTAADERPVELRFESVQTPVVARARETPDGLTVSTPLPLLTRGAELSVRFEGESQTVVGRVARVSISEHDGTPRLDVELALSETAGGRFRRSARYGYADEIASAVGNEPVASAAGSGRDETTETGRRAIRPRRVAAAAHALPEPAAPRVPERTRLQSAGAVLRIAGSLVLAGALGAAASAWVEHSFRSIDAQPSPQAAMLERDPPLGELHAQSAESEPADPAIAVPAPVDAPAVEVRGSTSKATPPASEAPASAEQDGHAPQAAPAEPSAGTALDQTFTGSLPGSGVSGAERQSPAREPQLTVDGKVTIVTIPFTGSLDGMKTTTWASPAAVAIDLPHGSSPNARSYYPLSGGIAAGLRLQQRDQQLLVRVLLAQAVSRIAVSAQHDALEIRLTAAP